MRMTILAAAVAALAFLLPATQTVHAMEYSQGVTEINIARIKSVLRLTPEQQAYWPPVEAALRSIARHQAQDESAGFVRRISHRVVAIVLDSAAIQRLATAARPLIVALRDDQRRDARALAQEMGLGPVVAALN
ncbi:MAG TPA: hypothetical protein VHD14_06795 [Pseudolabrys sp.]|nr:hypothetical protein [Pseudolabrys sp.]